MRTECQATAQAGELFLVFLFPSR